MALCCSVTRSSSILLWPADTWWQTETGSILISPMAGARALTSVCLLILLHKIRCCAQPLHVSACCFAGSLDPDIHKPLV